MQSRQKDVPGVCFFYPESTVAFTQTIQPFVLVYFRFIGMYVCAQRLLLSVCMQEKR